MLEIKQQVPLAQFSTFQLGGPARFAVSVSSVDELREALAWAADQGVRWRVLGGGSNLLVSDAGFDGLIIWYKDKTLDIDEASGVVRAGAGAITAQVAGATVRAHLTGFEWAAGVPGTIGGAVYGNAGASGGEMKDAVTHVTVFEQGNVTRIPARDCGFRYRHSAFKERAAVILSVELQLARASDPQEPLRKMREVLEYRMKTQPKGLASSGCTFKNYEPTDYELDALRERGVPEPFLTAHRVPAGWLIEHAGLKGVSCGRAEVSQVHGNFIVNKSGATATHVIELIAHVKDEVAKRFGVKLEEEITIVA